jgi:hypothetical protein
MHECEVLRLEVIYMDRTVSPEARLHRAKSIIDKSSLKNASLCFCATHNASNLKIQPKQ